MEEEAGVPDRQDEPDVLFFSLFQCMEEEAGFPDRQDEPDVLFFSLF